MLVSVVVPAYNEEKYLGACLGALCAQEHSTFEYELIVVDDGSTDRTRQIALAHGVRVISQPNRGVASARQAGFEAARGEIIASTDADTIVAHDWLQNVVCALHQRCDAVAVCGPLRLSDRAQRENAVIYVVSRLILPLSVALKQPAFSGANFAVRRAAWRMVGGFDTNEAAGEDLKLARRLQPVGTIVFAPRMVVATSGRRWQDGRFKVLLRGFVGILRVQLFGKSPLPFTNVR